MTPSALRRAVEKLETDYWAAIEKLAAEVRAKYVVPFCDHSGMRFTTGMGVWSFDLRGRRISDYESEGLPSRLARILHQQTIQASTDIGLMVEDYTPQGWSE